MTLFRVQVKLFHSPPTRTTLGSSSLNPIFHHSIFWTGHVVGCGDPVFTSCKFCDVKGQVLSFTVKQNGNGQVCHQADGGSSPSVATC